MKVEDAFYIFYSLLSQVMKTHITFAIRREQSKEEIDDYTTRELARLYAHVSQQPDTPTKKLFLQRVSIQALA